MEKIESKIRSLPPQDKQTTNKRTKKHDDHTELLGLKTYEKRV